MNHPYIITYTSYNASEGSMEPNISRTIIECEKAVPFLKIISNTTRLKILCILKEGERKVGEIQEMLGAKQSYVSQQLKYLKNRGYLINRREGTQIYYQLSNTKFPEILKNIVDALERK